MSDDIFNAEICSIKSYGDIAMYVHFTSGHCALYDYSDARWRVWLPSGEAQTSTIVRDKVVERYNLDALVTFLS